MLSFHVQMGADNSITTTQIYFNIIIEKPFHPKHADITLFDVMRPTEVGSVRNCTTFMTHTWTTLSSSYAYDDQ